MTLHRATYTLAGCQVIRSDDGGRTWLPVGPLFKDGRGARALIASIQGDLSPLRPASDDSPRQGQGRADSSLSAVTPQ